MKFSNADLELFGLLDEVGELNARAKQRLLDMAAYHKERDATAESRLETLKVVLKARSDETRAFYDSVHAKLDELERNFFKDNFPKPACQPKPDHQTYLYRVREFVRVVWREPVRISRSHGYKSVLEWMNEIDRTRDSERIDVSEQLRKTLVETGFRISLFLLEYLCMISYFVKLEKVEELLGEVKDVIGSLGVEEGSVVIKCFVAVVELFRETRGKLRRSARKKRKRKGTARSEYGTNLTNLFLIIATEILNLEANYGNPVFPYILSRETLSGSTYNLMAQNLDVYFKAQVTEIRDEVDDIQAKSDKQSITDFLIETGKPGVSIIWQELECFNDENCL